MSVFIFLTMEMMHPIHKFNI